MYHIEYLALKAASYAVYGIYYIYMLLIWSMEKLFDFGHCAWILIRRTASVLYIFTRKTVRVIREISKTQKPIWQARARSSWAIRNEIMIECRRPLALPCSDEWG